MENLRDNLLESHPLIFDGFIVENGSIYYQTEPGYAGDDEPALLEKYSRPIPVKAGEEYTVYQSADKFPWCAIGIYDFEGKGITRLSTSDAKYKFTIPEGAVTMILCARTHYLTDIALFKKGDYLCGEQHSRENYLNLNKINETPICAFDDIVKAVNHRGYNTIAPENTLAAFKVSKEKGFKYVECDVSFTSDGYAVLLHDSTVDRTSNGTGSIASMTLEDVRALDFGSWKSAEYAGEQIPRFEEFIALCRALGLHPYIELKTGTEAQIKALVGVVKRHGMKGKVTWISFDAACLGYVKTADPAARLGFVVSAVSADTISTAEGLQTGENEVFIDCAFGNATAEAAQLCADADIPLEVWTVNGENDVKALDAYVTGVTSDNLLAGQVLSAANIK
jgi:glycerophosphoryl diester phosphodiesterase